MRTFKVQFDQAIADATDDVNRIYKQGVDNLFNAIIKRTPIDTGNAINGWWKAVGQVATSAGGTLDKLTIKDDAFLSNNVEYIQRLEYGHSQQAPDGMVRLTIAEANVYFEQAKRENR
jgi:hypothetical protein